MTQGNFVVGADCKALLQDAVQRNLPVKITNRKDTRCQVYKSALLAAQGNRLILADPLPNLGEAPLEPAAGQEIAVTFKKGYYKCLFTARIIGRCQFQADATRSIPALTVLWPDQIERFQRRAFNRAPAPLQEIVTVNFWSTDPANRQPQKKYHGILFDLSAGGLGITVSPGQLPDAQAGDPFEIWFVPLPDHEPLCLPGSFRHATELPQQGRFMLGFQLIGLELSPEGRALMRWLGRIATTYQRRHQLADHHNLMNR